MSGNGDQEREQMSELQALVTGAIMGMLSAQNFLEIETYPVSDEEGFLPEIRVVGKVTGTWLKIRVEDTTEEEA